MLDERLQAILLIGGLALVGLGVIVGLVLLVVSIVRRQRSEPEGSPQLGEAFLPAPGVAADERPFALAPSAAIPAAAAPDATARPFVASASEATPPGPSWAELIASEEEVGGTSAFFAAAGRDLPSGPPVAESPKRDPDPPGLGPAAPVVDSVTLTPQAAADHGPAAADGPEDDEEDRTILLGRADDRAPWILILDTGERVGIPADSVVLGRRTAAVEDGRPGVRIPDATRTVSKVHAHLDRIGERWTITDAGSTNGCIVIDAEGRERRVAAGQSEEIRGRFLLGEVGMVLVRNPEWSGA